MARFSRLYSRLFSPIPWLQVMSWFSVAFGPLRWPDARNRADRQAWASQEQPMYDVGVSDLGFA